ncbi:histone acetyltransferase subunit NuA4-domain-containing protein [Pholiota molesta]|nr:histone acetyltransferase subunit NuA4-domain-containing protein [Pholiota molesta]
MAEQGPLPAPDDRSRYETLKKELMQALPKKRAIDKQLAQIEVQIYNLEASYLTETAAHSGGNIIQGFENYLKNQSSGRRRYEVHDHDRIFSNSSLTYQKSLELMGEGEESTATNDEYVKQSTPAPLTTIAVPPATRTQELTLQSKRAKDRDYQRKRRATASHRSTGDSDEELVSAASASSRRPTKRSRIADDD